MDTPTQTGIVKWFDDGTGFGFLEVEEAHVSLLKYVGHPFQNGKLIVSQCYFFPAINTEE